jgi:hypothetical protein
MDFMAEAGRVAVEKALLGLSQSIPLASPANRKRPKDYKISRA